MTTAAVSTTMAVEQVLSWLHDEETTVTAQKIQQECFGERNDDDEACLSRKEGSRLLRDLYEKDPQTYSATIVRASISVDYTTDNTDNDNDNVDKDSTDTTNANAVRVTSFSCHKLSPGASLDNDASASNCTSTPTATSTATATATVLALSSAKASLTEALESAHESDMSVLRDRLFHNNTTTTNNDTDPSWFYNHRDLSHIQASPSLGGFSTETKPAEAVEKTWHKYEREGTIVRPSKNQTKTTAAKPTKTTASNKVVKAKPTTAQNFFGKKPSAPSKTTTTSKKAAVNKTKPPKSSKTTTTANDDDDDYDDDYDDDDDNDDNVYNDDNDDNDNDNDDNDNDHEEDDIVMATKTKPPEAAFSKRVRPLSKREEKVVGNADDFVGDEDEDSDDEQDMEARREKSKEIVRKQKEQDDLLDALGKEEDHDVEVQAPKLVKGAMDAFATKAKAKPSSEAASTTSATGKKRRKVLKEKTSVNAQGFLVTTTEAIWEDVSSDEDNDNNNNNDGNKNTSNKEPTKRSAAAKPKAAPIKKKTIKKKASGMKQGSLMGFFAVKKPK